MLASHADMSRTKNIVQARYDKQIWGCTGKIYIYIYIFVLLHTNVIKKKKNIYILSMSIKGSKPIQEKKC